MEYFPPELTSFPACEWYLLIQIYPYGESGKPARIISINRLNRQFLVCFCNRKADWEMWCLPRVSQWCSWRYSAEDAGESFIK